GLGGASQRTVQGVFGAAVDDPLGLETLAAAEAGVFHQQGGVAQAAQAGVEPAAGDTAADDQDIGAERLGHAGARCGTGAQYTGSVAAAAGEQLDYQHPGDDQADAEQGRQVELLVVDQQPGDADQHDAQTRPDGVGDAHRNAL